LIDDASTQSQEQKNRTGFLLSSQDQQIFFELAFSHFSRNIDKPIDFIKELLVLQPPYHGLRDNISQFLRTLFETMTESNSQVFASDFMAAVAPVLSSTIALDRSRYYKGVPGALLNIFTGNLDNASGSLERSSEDGSYKASVSAAIIEFCDSSVTCDFGNECGKYSIARRHT
jgi:hypothetical protein